MMSSAKIDEDIGNCIRQNIPWNILPVHLKKILENNQKCYEKYIFNYSLKNQLRFRGNLIAKIFCREQRYYELLIQKSINTLCLFPYHLADIVTKGLRVTPFNYYQEILVNLLCNDKSYDTIPNFTAADCLRVLGIGRNEYLALIGDVKTHTSKSLLLNSKPNPVAFLPKFPQPIRIEPWWRIEVGYVLETDMQYVTHLERSLIDELIDFGPQIAGKCNYAVVRSLYRKGLIYLDVPISSEDRICIPPLKNFVMNRTSGDYFENLLYKIFVSTDEHMTILELAQMLQLDLDSVKQAVSLFCRLGFAQLKQSGEFGILGTHVADKNYHSSWEEYKRELITAKEIPQVTPLNYNNVMNADKDSGLIGYVSSDCNTSEFSFATMQTPSSQSNSSPQNTNNILDENEPLSSEIEDLSESTTKQQSVQISMESPKVGKRIAFLFDSTLTAFLMMGNLSPSLKNHAVTMFEVGKLCEESLDTFLVELEKVSLLDAEGEGDVSRYFTHAVILRSTICSLRHLLPGGMDLLRLECLECLDQKTRDRVIEKKYKFIIAVSPLQSNLSHCFTIPFFGQFYCSVDCSHMWTKLFYNHISGYGPPSLFLCRGTILKTLPRLFLGYGKLLINILHSDAYVINSENFQNVNDQLKNGCVFIQAYGIRSPGILRYEAFPFDKYDHRSKQCVQHCAIKRLEKHLDLKHHCGYITFLNNGVPDIGCENNDLNVTLKRPQRKGKLLFEIDGKKKRLEKDKDEKETLKYLNIEMVTGELLSPESTELTTFALSSVKPAVTTQLSLSPSSSSALYMKSPLKSPDENFFSNTPEKNALPSKDCNELLAANLSKCIIKEDESEEEEREEEGIQSNSIEKWTLLDVHFGVPLFDVDTNTRICEQIVRHLHEEDNLKKLKLKSEEMSTKFHNFVKQCMYFVDELDEKRSREEVKQPEKQLHDDDLFDLKKGLPHPRINLAFENGRVCYWNGR